MAPPAPTFSQAFELHRAGRLAEAERLYGELLRARPDHFEVLQACGVLALQTGRAALAAEWLSRAVAAQPAQPSAHYNQGLALAAIGRLADAVAAFGRAATLHPAYAAAHFNRGHALLALGRPAEALPAFDAALALQPGYLLAHIDRGHACAALERYPEAIASLQRALALQPDAEFLPGTLLDLRMRVADWRGHAEAVAALAQGVAAGRPVSPPFQVVVALDDPALQLRAARSWVERRCPPVPGASLPPRPADGRRLRIGYFSADFHDHATSWLLAGVLEAHDRAGFELQAFSWGPRRDDALRRRIVAACDAFHEVGDLGDAEAAALARERGLDIAVDLKGFTAGGRPGIFAQRCAPLQVAWLGYPGTSGAPYFDYVLADRQVLPRGDHWPEQPVWLPGAYQPNDRSRPEPQPVNRLAAGLPAQAFVFCGFNQAYKITPERFATWMRILQRSPGAVLWLLADHPEAVANLRREASKCGVEAGRLVFAAPAPLATHLGRLAAADLFLDTFPCTAHTTASDALWAGLPLLTRAGDSFVSRVAASLLRVAGLPELVVDGEVAYEELAVALAADPDRLAGLRRRLAAARDSGPLFDATVFARGLEVAFRAMQARAQAGLAPAPIDLSG